MLTRPSVVVRATHKNFIVSLKRSSEKLEKQYTVHHQQSMRTIFWKFELLIENSRETSIHSTKSWATFQAAFRQHHWYFKEVKTIAVSKIHGQFVQVSFPLKIRFFSPLFVEIRGNSLKFALITFAQYCTSLVELVWSLVWNYCVRVE